MKDREQNTEQIILEAAEAEFLEKGYSNAKMMAIAQRAGVAHSMLHYYFRSKENLFQGILQQKMRDMFSLQGEALEGETTFEGLLRKVRDLRDRFFAANPKFAYFILTEVMGNAQNRALLVRLVEQMSRTSMVKLRELLEQEMAAGRMRRMRIENVILMMITLDVAMLTAISQCREEEGIGDEVADRLLAGYKERNLQLFLEALRPLYFFVPESTGLSNRKDESLT